jgi:hypothetical protein
LPIIDDLPLGTSHRSGLSRQLQKGRAFVLMVVMAIEDLNRVTSAPETSPMFTFRVGPTDHHRARSLIHRIG